MAADATARCDALVLLGATGDLAGKMIFPALARLHATQALDFTVVAVGGISRGGAGLDRVRARIAAEAPELTAAFTAMARRIRYVEADLTDPRAYATVAAALAGAVQPLFYLAIPPALFAPVIRTLGETGLAARARVAIEKPFGHDVASAEALERTIEDVLPDDAVYRIDHFLAKAPVRALADLRAHSAWLDALWSRQHVRSVQITMAESFGIGARGRFYEATGALRDVFQSHLLQLVAIIAMEPAPPADAGAFAAARIAALRAVRALRPDDVVYGQYDGYRDEPQVARDSRVPTYFALRLGVDTPRFAGVPFYVRAGKRLARTTTQLAIELAPAPGATHAERPGERLRIRLGPGAAGIALEASRTPDRAARPPEPLVLRARLADEEERAAYVHILRALVAGDRGISVRFAGAIASWRAIDHLLHQSLPVYPYAPGSFGPPQGERVLAPGERWDDPAPD